MDGLVINAATLAAAQKAMRALQPTLPPLREELRLLPAAPNHDGSPAWMIQDPVNNRFFRIGWIDFEILLRWSQRSAKAIAQSISDDTTLTVDDNDVEALLLFLEQHSLLQANSPNAVDRLRRLAAQMQKNPYEWLLHNSSVRFK